MNIERIKIVRTKKAKKKQRSRKESNYEETMKQIRNDETGKIITYDEFKQLIKKDRRLKGRKTENLDGFRLIELPESWKKTTRKKVYKTEPIKVTSFNVIKLKL